MNIYHFSEEYKLYLEEDALNMSLNFISKENHTEVYTFNYKPIV